MSTIASGAQVVVPLPEADDDSLFGSKAVGVLMTGMGEDGAEGLGELKAAGAVTIAQDEASSVVYGMPKAAIEKGYAQRVVSLEMMPNTLVAQCTVKAFAKI